MRQFPFALAALAGLAIACSSSSVSETVSPATVPLPALTTQTVDTRQLLQAVSVVSNDVVWVSGHGGTWARTVDGGATWTTGVVPGADSLQFRDLHALDAKRVWLMSAGTGAASQAAAA